ncbi:MAG TPA: electron transport complex subunit RsxC [Enterococcus sp.]|uniref:electron transport complex subunit RsxC n=2 Tax=Enterococcus sp. TaxID=35783 RepID=UPI000ED52B19|nr:electron transport complex subunit RsxC [Enterococcus sp.]HCE13258.1 electron transport complex subunit RsxC [Enterococcus sp.]
MRTFTGGISLSPPLKMLKEKLMIDQDDLLCFSPTMVFIPLAQHIGAPVEPLVSVGDYVKQGQVIAEADAFVSAKVHASVSGTIVDIVDWPNQNNGEGTTIIIENDFKYSNDFLPSAFDWSEASNKEILAKIQAGGIAGKGGATFPTHVKFSVDDTKKIHTLILNGSECEPFLRSDAFLMQKEAQQIITGAKIAQKLLADPKILIGIEDDKPQAIKAMTAASADDDTIEVVTVPTVYPTGGEKQLVELLTDQEVPVGGLTADIGIVLINVATSFALADAVCFNKPLIERYTTVTGDVQNPCIVKNPLGTLAGELIDFAGGFQGAPSKLILGGPMMGKAVNTLKVPVTKGSNGVIVFNEETDWLYKENPCIRCNKCVEACPMRLMPMEIDQYYRAGDYQKCEDLLAEACINCGACTFVCPAKRSLAANITAAKSKVAQLQEEAKESA